MEGCRVAVHWATRHRRHAGITATPLGLMRFANPSIAWVHFCTGLHRQAESTTRILPRAGNQLSIGVEY
jgi:hypothetical protein